MVRFNTLCIFYGLVIYYIRIVSSILLDLENVNISKFYTMRIVERGVTKIMILSTPENKITEVYNGIFFVWSPDPGEYVKCVTIYEFRYTKRVIMSIEIENPRKTDMYYLSKYRWNYKYISKEDFEKEYQSMLLIEKELEYGIQKQKHESGTEKVFIPKRKRGRPRKHKPKIKDTDYKTRKSKKQSIAQEETTQQLEKLDPEVTTTTKEESEESKEPTQTPTKESKTDSAQITQLTEEPKPQLQPEITPVEIGSDEEPEEEEPVHLSQYYTETIEHIEPTSTMDLLLSDYEHLEPEELEISDIEPSESVVEQTEEELELDSIHFEISSDDEPEHTTEKEPEEHKEPEIEFEISSEESQPSESVTTKQTTEQPEHLELQPETIPVEIESDDEHEDIDLEQELLNEPLFGEDVEKLLERELDNIGLSTNELDSVFEEKSEDDN
uniref:Tash(AT)-like protein, putative n=1 Tax=Theileria annulata TaxID=5874 RepID=A0A3B0MK48_THEAN